MRGINMSKHRIGLSQEPFDERSTQWFAKEHDSYDAAEEFKIKHLPFLPLRYRWVIDVDVNRLIKKAGYCQDKDCIGQGFCYGNHCEDDTNEAV